MFKRKQNGGLSKQKKVMMHKSVKIITIIFALIFLISLVQASDWPMFQHDARHTGYTNEVVPDHLELIWSYKPGSHLISSPAVADGKVFFGSWDKLYCVGEDNGELLWSCEFDSWTTTPAIVDDMVFVSSGDTMIYCLDENTGDLIWSYKTGDVVYSSPVVVDGKLFVGSNDAKIYCLDENTGDLIWSYKTGDRVMASPSVAYGKVFVGSMDGKIYCLDENTGDLIWNYRTKGDCVQFSAAVAYGKVFSSSEDGRIYCLDAYNGDLIWSYKSSIEGDLIVRAPAVADGGVFASTKDGALIWLDADNGNVINYWSIGLCSYCSPAIANERIFVGFEESKVWSIDLSNDAQWMYRTDYHGVNDPPAIANGEVFFEWGSEIHCFGKPTPTPTPTPTPIPTYRDSDSDGVPDKYDYDPYDPDVQSREDIKTPAFEAVFAIAGLLTVSYLLRKRNG